MIVSSGALGYKIPDEVSESIERAVMLLNMLEEMNGWGSYEAMREISKNAYHEVEKVYTDHFYHFR